LLQKYSKKYSCDDHNRSIPILLDCLVLHHCIRWPCINSIKKWICLSRCDQLIAFRLSSFICISSGFPLVRESSRQLYCFSQLLLLYCTCTLSCLRTWSAINQPSSLMKYHHPTAPFWCLSAVFGQIQFTTPARSKYYQRNVIACWFVYWHEQVLVPLICLIIATYVCHIATPIISNQ
jgi:hypothetical protein